MPGALDDLETRLWDAADDMRANSGLGPSEYSTPVLGLIFLRFADVKFQHADEQVRAAFRPNSRHTIGPTDYQARGVMYLPEKARYSRLMQLPESADIGSALNDAMRAIEDDNSDLRGVLPTNYTRPGLTREILWSLLRLFAGIPLDIEGDVFGKIYRTARKAAVSSDHADERACVGFSQKFTSLPCIQWCDRINTWRTHRRPNDVSQFVFRWTYWP